MTGQLNIVGMHAAHASYQDKEFQRYTLQNNRKSLDIAEGMCDELGLCYVKSHANSTFIHTGRDIADVSAALLVILPSLRQRISNKLRGAARAADEHGQVLLAIVLVSKWQAGLVIW